MFSRINESRQISIVPLVMLAMFLAGACGPILPEQGRSATATNAPTFTPIPPIVTPTWTLDVIYIIVTPSPPPTRPPLPIFTPDAVQLERWQEYQMELAKVLLYGYGPDPSKDSLCEWDILGRSGQEVYVWAYCASIWGNGIRPAVIYLDADDSIREVKVAGYKGPDFDLDLFPADVQEKRGLYTGNSLFNGRLREMINHLEYRETHPAEPPLVILSATTPTLPTP